MDSADTAARPPEDEVASVRGADRWLVLSLAVALTVLLAAGGAFVGVGTAIAHASGCGGG